MFLLAVGIAAVLILSWGFTTSPQKAYDDAYITYRYADNLRQGHGLLYNSGEWVLGTTTPLFALLLATLGLLVSDLEWLGHWVSVGAWILAAWGAARWLWLAARPYSAIFSAFLIALQPAILSSLGMESAFLVALMLWSACFWLNGRRWAAVPLLAALILTRQDAALWVLALGLEIWRRERLLPWREATLTILITLPWFFFALWRYGSILPNSALAKIGQNDLMVVDNAYPFIGDFWQALTTPDAFIRTIVILLSLALALAVIVTKDRQFLWLVGWLVAYLGIYHWLGVWGFPWYFVPPLVVTYLLMALGAGYVSGDGRFLNLLPDLPGKKNRQAWQTTIGFFLAFLLLLGQWPRIQDAAATGQGHRPSYRAVGQWLAANTEPTATVATIEIGVIGYLSQRPILDTMGLVSREMTSHQTGWVETLVYAVTTFWPEYVVVLPGTAWDWLLGQWWFTESYQPVVTFDEVTIYGLQIRPSHPYETAVQATYTSGLTLNKVGFHTNNVQPGQHLDVILAVDVHESPPTAYQFTTFLADAQTGMPYAITSQEPFSGGYATQLWQPGDRLVWPVRLELPDDLPVGAYRLGILLYDPEQAAYVPQVGQPDHEPYPVVLAGWLRYGQPLVAPPLSQSHSHPVNVQWQDGIRLTQVGVTPVITAGEELPVQLTWQPTAAPAHDWTVFVHLVDAAGNIVAQQDQKPFDGRFPTPVWRPGEVLTDTLHIPIPADLPAASYALRLGFYDVQNRLPLAGVEEDYWLLLDFVTVARP